jgi:diguanylate cyclase
MKFQLPKKNRDNQHEEVFRDQLADCGARLRFSQQSIQSLLDYLREFSLDVKEIDSDAFNHDITDLSAALESDKKLKKLKSIFEKYKKRITRFIQRQQVYILDREKEFKDIIDLLTKALATLDSENQEYNQKIYARSEKIEHLTRLDDIKKIKQELEHEIKQMRETIRKKQSHDTGELELLSKKVSALDTELKKAREESMHDGLTGVYNRRAFDDTIREMVEWQAETGAALSILILDVDDFKAVNDCYGHQIGDRVLVALARKCSGLIRSADVIARYGGEEFVILLPDASLKDAVAKANAMCKSVSETRYALDDGEADHTLSVTISIGVSQFQPGDTPMRIIERADKALYQAKHSGKNRVASEMDLHEETAVSDDSVS